MRGDVSTGMEVAFDEMSSFVDRQMDITENLDQELLTLMKFSILLAGSVYPVFDIFVQSDNGVSLPAFLPWILLAVFVLLYSTWFSAQGYRNGIYYGGFEDSPFLTIQSTTNITPVRGSLDLDEGKMDFPSDDEFYQMLLNDYSIGIAHNNWEIKFKADIVHHVFRLLSVSIGVFIIGTLLSIAPGFGSLGDVSIHTGVFLVASLVILYQVYKAQATYREFTNRSSIEGRLSAEEFHE